MDRLKHTLAYDLGNFMRVLALPEVVKQLAGDHEWSGPVLAAQDRS